MVGLIALGLTMVCLFAKALEVLRDRFPQVPPPGYHGSIERKDDFGLVWHDHYRFSSYVGKDGGCGCASCEKQRQVRLLEDRYPELTALVRGLRR